MAVTQAFHDAVITSIASYAREESINIYDLIRTLIVDLTHIISGSGRNAWEAGNPERALDAYNRRLNAIFGWGDDMEKHKRKHCAKFLTKVDAFLKKEEEEWDDITWCDVITYLIFIQSNCHHRGKALHSTQICKSPDSFLNFFHKSKNGLDVPPKFNQSENGLVISYTRSREGTKKAEYLAGWWVKVYKEDVHNLLMFHDLVENQEERRTVGWTSRGFGGIAEGDYLPWGAVINTLREYHRLPPLSGDYSVGFMQGRSGFSSGPNFRERVNKKTIADDMEELDFDPMNPVLMGVLTGITVFISLNIMKKGSSYV